MITLQEDEKIIAEAHRHWFVIAIQGFYFFLFAILPFVVVSWLVIVFPLTRSLATTTEQGGVLFVVVFFLAAWLYLFWLAFVISWTNYYLDILVITNKRIIDIEQFGLFSRDQASLPIKNVQDIKVKVVGLIPELLKFGNLDIQTAGEAKEFVIRDLRDPEKVKNIINEVYFNQGQGHY